MFEQIIEEIKEQDEMRAWIVDDILGDALGNYDGDKADQVRARLEDIQHGGGLSGTIGSLIYTADCVAFFDKYKEQIGLLVHYLSESMGENVLDSIRGFDKEDPFCVTDYNKNIMAWLAYEEVASELMDALEQMED